MSCSLGDFPFPMVTGTQWKDNGKEMIQRCKDHCIKLQIYIFSTIRNVNYLKWTRLISHFK